MLQREKRHVPHDDGPGCGFYSRQITPLKLLPFLFCVLCGLPSSGDAARTVHITLRPDHERVTALAVDPSGTFVYVATTPQSFRYTMPSLVGHLLRVQLRDFILAGDLALKAGENNITAIAISPNGKHAYLGTYGDPNTDLPASLIRVRLPGFSREKDFHFESGTYGLHAGIVSRQGQAAYWGTLFGEIAGTSLPDMNSLGSVMLQKGKNAIYAGVIDPTARYVYFGTGSGVVLKIDVNQWLPAATLSLQRQESGLTAAAIDREGHYTYWATEGSPARLSRVDLTQLDAAGDVLLAEGENIAVGVFLDEAHKMAYVVTQAPGAQVVRIQLDSLKRIDAQPLPTEFGDVACATYDQRRRKIYLGMGSKPARLVQVDMTVVPAPLKNPSETH